jgi:hypothetical protein
LTGGLNDLIPPALHEVQEQRGFDGLVVNLLGPSPVEVRHELEAAQAASG